MIWFIFLAIYLLGWFPAAVMATKAREGRMDDCPNGNSDTWCRIHHPVDHRKRLSINAEDAAIGSLIGLAWPIVAPGYGVLLAAKSSRGHLLTDRELAELEREAGL